MASGPDVIQLSDCRNPAKMRETARMDDARADVVDELLLNETVAIIDAVEHLSHRERRRRVLPDGAKSS